MVGKGFNDDQWGNLPRGSQGRVDVGAKGVASKGGATPVGCPSRKPKVLPQGLGGCVRSQPAKDRGIGRRLSPASKNKPQNCAPQK